MKLFATRVAGLAFALCTLVGAWSCTLPQIAWAQDAYTAQTLDSNALFNDGYYFTLLQESNGVTYTGASGGSIVALDPLPEAYRKPAEGHGDYWNYDTPPWRYSYTWPALVNNRDANGTYHYIGGNGDAFAFVADANPAANGAAGAEFTATWKKAAILRSTDGRIDSPNTLPDGGLYVDIRVKFKLVNTIAENTKYPKAVVQFHNRFDWGFWQMNITRMDQTVTFLDSATGDEVPIHGKISVLGTSMDKGEGFALNGASAAAVSSTAPVTNTHVPGVSANSSVPANMRWSTVPGSYVYEFNEGGWLGYLGAPILEANADEKLYHDPANFNTLSEVEYVDNKYDSARVFKLGGTVFPTDADKKEGYDSAVTYPWRAAAIEKDMGGASGLVIRQYAVGYTA